MAPVPSSLFKDKPPVDGGVYVYNMTTKDTVAPNRPMSEYDFNSWPPGNWKGFIEFHVVGLLILSFFSSVVANSIFYSFKRNGYDPAGLYIYYWVTPFGAFNFSTLGIVKSLSILGYLVFAIALFRIMFKIRRVVSFSLHQRLS